MDHHITHAVAQFISQTADLSAGVVSVSYNSENGTSANSQGPPTLSYIEFGGTTRRRGGRLYARRLTNEECIRAVEEGGVKGEDACPICLDEEMKQPVQLIHFEKRSGPRKANLCKTAMCFSCLQNCIKSQKPQQRGLIRPQCPCCRGDIYKAVTLSKPNVVLNLPAFKPLTYGDLIVDATRLSLTFNVDRTRHEAGGYIINNWRILTPVESASPSNMMFVDSHEDWEALFNTSGVTQFRLNSVYNNFPTQREIFVALKQKLDELNERGDIPSVYRLSLEEYLAEEKAKAARNTVVDLTDSPVKKKRKKAVEQSAGCCGSCSKPSSK